MALLRFYTTESIGETRSKTPEGFLVLQDVPIGRTGVMVYGRGEVPVRAGSDGEIRIDRDEGEVFRPETLASFQGKPITDDHPSEDVTPANWRQLARGVTINPRRGERVKRNLMLADLMITDADMIEAIDGGLREISCGYDAEYVEISPGRGRQVNIVGNHVAFVRSGRCGPICSIGDRALVRPAKFLDAAPRRRSVHFHVHR